MHVIESQAVQFIDLGERVTPNRRWLVEMEQEVYHEDSVKKRQEKREVWENYWAVLKNSRIFLYIDKNDVKSDAAECCEEVCISPGARCAVVKRRTYSFRFKLVTAEKQYFFKCVSNLQRHRWMHSIELAAKPRYFFPYDRHVSRELLLQPVLTDTDLKRYFYGEKKESDEMNDNNNNTDYKQEAVLSVVRASSATISSRPVKVTESRRVKSAAHLPWKTRLCKVHSSDAGDFMGRRLEIDFGFSDDGRDILNAIYSKERTIGADTTSQVQSEAASTNSSGV